MKEFANMREYMAKVITETEAQKKAQRESLKENEERQCDGSCPDCMADEMDVAISEAMGELDLDDLEDTVAQLAKVVMIMAKRDGMSQTARAAFDIWIQS